MKLVSSSTGVARRPARIGRRSVAALLVAGCIAALAIERAGVPSTGAIPDPAGATRTIRVEGPSSDAASDHAVDPYRGIVPIDPTGPVHIPSSEVWPAA